MTREIKQQVIAVIDAYSDSCRLQADINEELDKLVALWGIEQARLSKIAMDRARRMKENGTLMGRPKVDLPSADAIRKRLKLVDGEWQGINKLAKELGVCPHTLRKRLKA